MRSSPRPRADRPAEPDQNAISPDWNAVECLLPRAYAADDLEQSLRSRYGNKTLVLRGFYHGNKLKCDSAGMLAGNSPRRHRGACRFGQELAAVPGGSESGQDKDIATKIAGAPLVRIGKGVTPARGRSAPSPEFSTEARELHYPGTVTLWLVVDTDAEPRNIRIAKPLGMGLRKEDTRFAQRPIMAKNCS